MCWLLDNRCSEFLLIPWSALKMSVDWMIPFWSQSQTLLQATCTKWLPLVWPHNGIRLIIILKFSQKAWNAGEVWGKFQPYCNHLVGQNYLLLLNWHSRFNDCKSTCWSQVHSDLNVPVHAVLVLKLHPQDERVWWHKTRVLEPCNYRWQLHSSYM